MLFCRRAFAVLLLICLGCSAQSTSPDLTRLLEKQVRRRYSVPASVALNVGPLRPSEFPNYDALTITFDNAGKKQDYEFLLAKDRKTMLRLTKIDLTQDPYVELMKKIDVSNRPTRGNKDAKVVAISYDDFECPFCSVMHQTLFPAFLKEYGDRVLFIYKDFPLEEMHPWAVHAAVDANCLAAQNNDAYWDYADDVHRGRDTVQRELQGKGREAANAALDKFATLQGQKHNLDVAKLQACLKAQDDKAVRASMHEGDTIGVDSTPALFINGQKVEGAVSAGELRTAFDNALQDAGVAVPKHQTAADETNAAPAKPSK